jgi:prophage antirepressor-like protein
MSGKNSIPSRNLPVTASAGRAHEVRVFTFDAHGLKFDVRAIVIDGDPWFIAMDVSAVLGYSDAFKMTARLDEDEKSNRQIGGLGSPTGGRGVSVISESGLYVAIVGSKKPDAKPFRRWVTGTVLPSLRKTGAYLPDGYIAVSREEHEELLRLRRSIATASAHAAVTDLHLAAERVETTSQATASVHARELSRRRRQKRVNAALLKTTARAMQRDLFADPVDGGRIDLEAALVASANECPAIAAVATVAVEAIRAIQSMQTGGSGELRAMHGQEKPPSIH